MYFIGRLISITISYSLFIALTERLCTFAIYLYFTKVQRNSKGVYISVRPEEDIQSLRDFDYRDVEPIKYRPFKTKYHVTLGTSTVSPRVSRATGTNSFIRSQEIHQT